MTEADFQKWRSFANRLSLLPLSLDRPSLRLRQAIADQNSAPQADSGDLNAAIEAEYDQQMDAMLDTSNAGPSSEPDLLA
jgi:hypothetical protein